MAKRNNKPTPAASFAVGGRVRVKHGVRDFDHPDLPLGGWAATIVEVNEDGLYTLRWTEETLQTVHPVYRNRCERDGADYEVYTIDADDLTPDPGGPLDIEHPAEIKEKPLSKRNQDDRIRMVLGLTSNDPLPDVGDDTLSTYREFLAANLSFPFRALYDPLYGCAVAVEVLALADADTEYEIDDDEGLLCNVRVATRLKAVPLADLRRVEGASNRQMVEDYAYWHGNWR